MRLRLDCCDDPMMAMIDFYSDGSVKAVSYEAEVGAAVKHCPPIESCAAPGPIADPVLCTVAAAAFHSPQAGQKQK